jgi:hypothetical protein
MFNLLSCGLISATSTPPAGSKASLLPSIDIDRTAIQSVLKTLTRPETGIFTYPAFLYFLEQEYFKCQAAGWPLTLVVFELKIRYSDRIETLPLPYVREVAKRIEAVKRPFDVLGHYETFDYALFLPNAATKLAKIIAARVAELVGKEQFISGPPNQVTATFGVASAPEDTIDLGILLSAAREAKNRARETQSPVVAFSEIEGR